MFPIALHTESIKIPLMKKICLAQDIARAAIYLSISLNLCADEFQADDADGAAQRQAVTGAREHRKLLTAEATIADFEKAINETVGKAMENSAMGMLTEKESARLAKFKAEFGKLIFAKSDPEGMRDIENRVLIELPLCFEGERQERFRRGWIGLLREQKQLAKSAHAGSEIHSITSALQMFKLNAGVYPTTEQGLQALVSKPDVAPIPRRWVRIMKEVPVDPWGNVYVYRMPGTSNPSKPEVFSKGPDGKEGTEDDITQR
jgi:general secretion pathway protein G